MAEQTLLGHLFVFCTRTAVVGIGVDADAAARREKSYHLYIFRLHQAHQVLHNRVHTILVEVTVVTEREEIELQALRLHHALAWQIEYLYLCKVWLTRNGAERGELRTVELNPIVVFLMQVLEGLEHIGVVVHRVRSLLA